LTCWKHRFSNHRDAEFWGPSYQCLQCGWWHIQYRDRRIAWERIVWIGLILLVGVLGWHIIWDVVKVAIEWNWP